MFSKIRLVFFILLLAALVGGFFFISRGFQEIFSFNKESEEIINLPAEDSVKPWIEVVSPKVFELDKKDNSLKKELFTGDELSGGMIIKVDDSGFANIYFPDGSAVRVDGGTEFVLEESSFNANSGKLVVRINLVLGRAWSKIISLATPDSVWEVRTSTAVATVRGTAFGMEYIEGKSTVIGSENEVAVSAVDPETKKVMKQQEVLVGAGKFVEIKKELAGQVASHIARIEAQKQMGAAVTAPLSGAVETVKLLAAQSVPEKIMKQEWVKKAKEADAKINEVVRGLKEVKTETKEISKEIRKAVRDEVKERTIEQRQKIKEVIEAELKQNEAVKKQLIKKAGEFTDKELLNRYETYRENPTKEKLEKLPPELLNNLPKEIPGPIKQLIPEEAMPAVEEFLSNPESREKIINSWELIKQGTTDAVNNMVQDAQKISQEENTTTKLTQ